MARAIVQVLVALAMLTPAPGSAQPRPFLGGLAFPTNMAWSTDGRLFFTEKDTGNVRVVEGGKVLPDPFVHLDVVSGGETGLLGIALDPRFPRHPWIYLYYSDAAEQRNRVVRFRADGNAATDEQALIDGLETIRGIHNGGDMAFGADGSLFIVMGETAQPERAQDPNDLGGKVLRINANGTLPRDDPFGPDNPVYSVGHRNSFGLCVDPTTGDLWETENGPASDDEVNRIVAGGNYGWPVQLGPGGGPQGFVDPVLDFPQVIVPTGCAVWHGDLYFGSFGDGVVRRLELPPGPHPAAEPVALLPGGVTDLEVGPDDALYISTSNAIWRLEQPPSGSVKVPPPTGPTPASDLLPGRLLIVFGLVGAIVIAIRSAARRRRGSA